MSSLEALAQQISDLEQASGGPLPGALLNARSLLRRARQQRPVVQARLAERIAADLARAAEAGVRPSMVGTGDADPTPRYRSPRLLAELRGVLDSPEGGHGAAHSVSPPLDQQELTLLGGDAAGEKGPPLRRELRALRLLRGRQREVAIQQRLADAIANAPEAPGPLNPQMLAIRALSAMRDYSPEYAKHFVAYLDTLMWLEGQAPDGDAAKGKARKPARRKSR